MNHCRVSAALSTTGISFHFYFSLACPAPRFHNPWYYLHTHLHTNGLIL